MEPTSTGDASPFNKEDLEDAEVRDVMDTFSKDGHSPSPSPTSVAARRPTFELDKETDASEVLLMGCKPLSVDDLVPDDGKSGHRRDSSKTKQQHLQGRNSARDHRAKRPSPKNKSHPRRLPSADDPATAKREEESVSLVPLKRATSQPDRSKRRTSLSPIRRPSIRCSRRGSIATAGDKAIRRASQEATKKSLLEHEEDSSGEDDEPPRPQRKSDSSVSGRKIRGAVRRSNSDPYEHHKSFHCSDTEDNKGRRGGRCISSDTLQRESPSRKHPSKSTSGNSTRSSKSPCTPNLKRRSSRESKVASRLRGDTTTKRKPPQSRDLLLDGDCSHDDSDEKQQTKAKTADIGCSLSSSRHAARQQRRSSRAFSPNMQRAESLRIIQKYQLTQGLQDKGHRKHNSLELRANLSFHHKSPERRTAGLRKMQRASSFRTQRKDRNSMRIQRASSFRSPKRDGAGIQDEKDENLDLVALKTKAKTDLLGSSSHTTGSSTKAREEVSLELARGAFSFEDDKDGNDNEASQKGEDEFPDLGYGVPFFSEDNDCEDVANIAVLTKMVVKLQREVAELRRELAAVKSQHQCSSNSDGAADTGLSVSASGGGNRPKERRRFVSPYDNSDDSSSDSL